MRRLCSARIWRRAFEVAFTEGGAFSGMGVVRPLQQSAREVLPASVYIPRDPRCGFFEGSIRPQGFVARLRLQEINPGRFPRARLVVLRVPVLGFNGGGFSHYGREVARMLKARRSVGGADLKAVSAQPKV